MESKLKKKLLNIVGDNKGWAIPNRAKNLAVYLRKYFEITDFFKWDLPDNFNDYDLIHMHHPVLSDKTYQIRTKWGIELPGVRTFGDVVKYKLCERANFVVAKNIDMFEKVKNICKGTLRCISNGVDTSIFNPPTYYIGWVGNETGQKQIDYKRTYLIDQSCNLLNVELKGLARVEFIKDPSEYPKIFPQEEVAKFYRKLDVFVLSSTSWEGSSNVTLEALATGLPVITTKTGDWKRLYKFGPNIIFPVEGTAEAIKEGLKHVLKDRLERRKVIVNNLSWKKISESYIELYREIGVL